LGVSHLPLHRSFEPLRFELIFGPVAAAMIVGSGGGPDHEAITRCGPDARSRSLGNPEPERG